jgi:hypothetical protein
LNRRTAIAALLVALPLGASAWETVAHSLRIAQIATPADWEAAAAIVRREKRPGDLVVAAPDWIRQTAYLHLRDDLVPLRDAARADTTTYARLWVVSIRDAEAPEAAGRRPDLDREVGRVRVRRYPLPRPARVVYDFLDRIDRARVTLESDAGGAECPWAPAGPRWRTGRFQCDPRRGWNRVGERVMDDLEHLPHRAIWAHPVDRKRLVIEFDDVPLATELSGYTGLAYEAARLTGGFPPVRLDVFVDDRRVARAVHHQTDVWKKWRVDTSASRGRRATVRFEVSARSSGMRHFYFVADTRDP